MQRHASQRFLLSGVVGVALNRAGRTGRHRAGGLFCAPGDADANVGGGGDAGTSDAKAANDGGVSDAAPVVYSAIYVYYCRGWEQGFSVLESRASQTSQT